MDDYAPVSYLQITKHHCENKYGESVSPPKVIYVDQLDNKMVSPVADSLTSENAQILKTKSVLLTKDCQTCQTVGKIHPPTNFKYQTGCTQVFVVGDSLHIRQQSILHKNGENSCYTLSDDISVDIEVQFLLQTVAGYQLCDVSDSTI